MVRLEKEIPAIIVGLASGRNASLRIFDSKKVNTEFIKIHKFIGSHRIVAKTMRPSMVQFNVVHIQRGSHKQYEAKFPIQLSVATPISIVNCVLVVDTAIVFDGA